MKNAAQGLPNRIQSLNESKILQIAARALANPDAIRLYAGESDEPTPEFIVDAADQAMRRGETRYVLSRGIEPLRKAIARYLSRTYSVPMTADRITVTVGGMQAISQSLLAILEPGEELLVPVPVWPNILEAAQVAGARVVAVEMQFDKSRGWHLDLNQLFNAVGPRTKAMFINSPGNPTGAVMTEAEVAEVLDFCQQRGIWIIADEVYGRLVYPPHQGKTAASFLSAADPEDRVIVTNTMSKNWSMTGWRVGWAVHPASLGLSFDNLMQYGSTGATTFAQHASVTALDEGDTHIDQMVAQCRIGRDIICDALLQVPGIHLVKPQGAFYVFFGIEGLTDSRQLAFDILDATGVGLAPGAAFHDTGEGWMRLCYGVSHATLQEAADRLLTYLKQ